MREPTMEAQVDQILEELEELQEYALTLQWEKFSRAYAGVKIGLLELRNPYWFG